MTTPSVQTGGFNILRNQAALRSSLIASIHNVEVSNEISVPAMFSFTLNMVSPKGDWQGANLDTFKPGDQITILLGLEKLERLIVGDITAIEPHFGQYSTATIRGFDRMSWLQFGTATRVYENLTDNGIVAEVARASKLTASTRGTRTEINKYVRQNQQSNYHFLLKRCAQINHELMMDGTTLVFRPSAEGLSPVRTLNFPRDLDKIDLKLRVPTKGSQVTVRSFDPATNRVISADSNPNRVRERMGGLETGYEIADDFPSSAITITDLSITQVEALQAVADAQYQQNLNRFIEGSASLVGDPQINAGVNIRLTGLSQRFDGTYYVTSSVHRYDDTTGYTTDVTLRRTGA